MVKYYGSRLNMTCGIYSITNKINNKTYIGCSKNIEYRWNSHISKNTGSVSLIHNAIKKYGKENFNFSVLLECPTMCFEYWEKHFIKKFNSIRPLGYNLTEGGKYNVVYSAETLNKLKMSHLGQIAWNKGISTNPLTAEHKEKISEKLKGIKRSPMSEHTKNLIREKRKSQIMRPVGEEARANMANAQKGKRHSEETKQKMKESQKKRFAHNGGAN